ncbi:MAG: hypothetical protein AB8B85_08345 [Paracoccaceae bacterium]
MADEQKYLYAVNWSSSRPQVDLEVQGVFFSSAGRSASVDALLPVSHWIRTGWNEMQLYAWPAPFDPEYELRLSLQYWLPDENPNKDARTAFTVVIYPGSRDPNPKVIPGEEGAPMLAKAEDVHWISRDNGEFFELNIRFQNIQEMPLWCWEQGDVLMNDTATRDSLAAEYRRLHGIFKAGSNDVLMEEYATMIGELAQASGQPEGYVRHRTGFQVFFDNPDLFELDPFPSSALKLNLGASDRVAWLTTKGVNVPVRFRHLEEEGVSSKVYLYFIHRDGRWEICR